MDSKEFIKLVSNVIKVDVCNTWINTDEEWKGSGVRLDY